MNPLYPDLFPETLLVDKDGSRIFTTAVKVAEEFKRRHDDVLKVINAVVKRTTDPVRLRNFAESSYLNRQAKRQPMYELSRDGFVFITMGFTGPEADAWKWKFLDAFNAMEAQLHCLLQREADGLYSVRPRWKPIVHNPKLSRKELIALTGHTAVGSITACRARMRQAGVLL